jgi:hypothetical protein
MVTAETARKATRAGKRAITLKGARSASSEAPDGGRDIPLLDVDLQTYIGWA